MGIYDSDKFFSISIYPLYSDSMVVWCMKLLKMLLIFVIIMLCYSYSIKKILLIFIIGLIGILFLYLFTIKKENFSQITYKMDENMSSSTTKNTTEPFNSIIYPNQVQVQQPVQYGQTQQTTPIDQYRQPIQYIQAQQPTQYVQSQQPTQYVQSQQPTQYVQSQQPTQYVQTQQPTQYVQSQQPTTPIDQYRQPTQYIQSQQPTQYVQSQQPVQTIVMDPIPIEDEYQQRQLRVKKINNSSFIPSKTTQSLFSPDGLLRPQKEKQYTSSISLLQTNQDPYQRMSVSQPKQSKNYYTPDLGTNSRMYQQPVMIAPRIMDSQFSSIHTQFPIDEEPLQDFGGMLMDKPKSKHPNLLLQRRNTEEEIYKSQLDDEHTFMRDIQPHVYSTSNERLPITSTIGISSTPQLPTLSRQMIKDNKGRLYPVYIRTNQQTNDDEDDEEENDDDKPKKKGKGDEDDKPKKKGKGDDDDKPKKKGKGDDDEEEDDIDNQKTPIHFNFEISSNPITKKNSKKKSTRDEDDAEDKEDEMDKEISFHQFYKKNKPKIMFDPIDPVVYKENPNKQQLYHQPTSHPSNRVSINSIRESRPTPQLPSSSRKMFREQNYDQTYPVYSRNDPQLIRDDVQEERREELPSRNAWSKDLPQTTGGNPIYDIYDPRFTGYGDESRSYYDTEMGQIKYYYSDIDAYRSPNFIIRNKVDHVDFIDPMGKTWSEYPRTASLEDVKEQVNDDWLARSTEFREDIMEKLMRKNNSESWQLRFAPKSRGARLSTFTSGY
jgi:hypothetical protein